jgi:hypothetical protein
MRLFEIENKNITYHVSPLPFLTKNKKEDIKKIESMILEIIDVVDNGQIPISEDERKEIDHFHKTIKAMSRGRLGDNGNASVTQLYVSEHPQAWQQVQEEEANITYYFGGIYKIICTKPITYYFTPAGMGNEYQEGLISTRFISDITGPFLTIGGTPNNRFNDLYNRICSKPDIKKEEWTDTITDILKTMKFTKIKTLSDQSSVEFKCKPYIEVVYGNERVYNIGYIAKTKSGYTIGYKTSSNQIMPNSFGIKQENLANELKEYK